MGLLDISATLDKYVIDNYSTPDNVSIADATFSEAGKDTWISVRYNPANANLIGLDGNKGRQELVGVYTVRCYAKYRKTSLFVADEVKTMLDGLVLGSLWLDFGNPTPPVNLDGDIWECTVNFTTRQA